MPLSSSGHYWFYEGFCGWWLYDADTNYDLEKASEQNEAQVEKLLAGHVYVLNLIEMTQYRKYDESRKRKICRATLELNNILGIAGLRSRNIDDYLEMMKFAESKSFRLGN